MCVRTIKRMLFIVACAVAMLFATMPPSADALMMRPASMASRASSERKISETAVEKAAAEADQGKLLLLGMGLVLTGTALRRKEDRTEE